MDRLERAICNALQPMLHQQGFELNKAWGYFVRKQPYGFDALLVVNQGTAKGRCFDIKCYAQIRHDRIEIPWNTFGFVYGEDNQKQTWTLNYKNMRGTEAAEMRVVPESMAADVARTAREVAAIFAQRAVPFYERFADLREVEAWANKDPLAETNPSLGGAVEDRGTRGLLLAKAVNPQRFPAVREAFLRLEKGMFPRAKRLEVLEKIDAMSI